MTVTVQFANEAPKVFENCDAYVEQGTVYIYRHVEFESELGGMNKKQQSVCYLAPGCWQSVMFTHEEEGK